MQLRHWLATGIGLGFLFGAPALAFAGDTIVAQGGAQLPQACVDAGVTNPAECKAMQARRGHRGDQGKPAEQAKPAEPAAPAEQAKPAEAPVTEKPAQQPAAEAPAEKPAGRPARQGRQNQQNQAEPAATDAGNPPAEKPAAGSDNAKPQRVRLPRACVAAGISTKADCDAFQAANNKPAEQPAAKPAPEKPAANPAPEQPAANPPATNEAAPAETPAPKPQRGNRNNKPAAADTNTAAPAAEGTGEPEGGRLPRDCVAAGLKTQADCDALHAINGQQGKPQAPAGKPAANDQNAPAANAPAAEQPARQGNRPAREATPTAPAGNLPAEVTPPKSQAEQQPAEQPAAQQAAPPDITADLNTAAKSYNQSVAGLAKAGGNGPAADKLRANIKAQQGKIEALCKTNNFGSTGECLAQYGVQLSPIPGNESGTGQPVAVQPAQPVEVINNLPKDVKPDEVAPLLDSAKDEATGKTPEANGRPGRQGQQGRPQRGQAQQPAPNAPPPTNDKAAQADIKPADIKPIDQTKGQAIDPNATNAPQVQVPQNVTVINQTVINNTTNNTTTNNTTTNTQVNNGPGVQQNNGAPGQQGNGRPGRPGDNRPGGGFDNRPGGNFPNGGPGRPGDNRPGFPGGRDRGEPNPIGLGVGLILQLGNQLIINSPAQDQQRIAHETDDRTQYEQLPNNRYRETITRPNGVRIVTIYNRNGDVLRRSRFDRAGHETVLAYFDDQYDDDLLNWRDPGDDLPPLQLHIPARDYVLDADDADEEQVQDFFAQPPVEPVQRLYSIDEVKRSARIRDMVRRLEVGDLTFDTGAATISEDQVGNLSKVAQAMLDLLDRNPAETFLIEGHTDAVGSDISNLQLSDARAATVARILTDFYHIPPENLATQGYGERFLKVQTDLAERINRRVTIRRITPLVTVATQNN